MIWVKGENSVDRNTLCIMEGKGKRFVLHLRGLAQQRSPEKNKWVFHANIFTHDICLHTSIRMILGCLTIEKLITGNTSYDQAFWINPLEPAIRLHFSHSFFNSLCARWTSYFLQCKLPLRPYKHPPKFSINHPNQDSMGTHPAMFILCQIHKREASFSKYFYNLNY